jgi:hypothetical protein
LRDDQSYIDSISQLTGVQSLFHDHYINDDDGDEDDDDTLDENVENNHFLLKKQMKPMRLITESISSIVSEQSLGPIQSTYGYRVEALSPGFKQPRHEAKH